MTILTFKTQSEIEITEYVDDNDDPVIISEKFNAGESIDVDIYEDCPEHYIVQFDDGSMSNIHKDLVEGE